MGFRHISFISIYIVSGFICMTDNAIELATADAIVTQYIKLINIWRVMSDFLLVNNAHIVLLLYKAH